MLDLFELCRICGERTQKRGVIKKKIKKYIGRRNRWWMGISRFSAKNTSLKGSLQDIFKPKKSFHSFAFYAASKAKVSSQVR
jgi:hypothetical protein